MLREIEDVEGYKILKLFIYMMINVPQHAIAYTGSSTEIYGAKATINVWEPSIEEINEFSLSQIWLLSGSFDGSDLNSIEAGWQVLLLLLLNYCLSFFFYSFFHYLDIKLITDCIQVKIRVYL